jgi:dTDP-4-dehydrorhamnose 3,5-epimerase
MGTVISTGILVTPLSRISTGGGDVLHAMKDADPGFAGFGEAYFSLIRGGDIKAWKRHTKMVMNLAVPIGEVRFVFYSEVQDKFQVIHIGEAKYERITVPPGVWFGFQGITSGESLVLNLANIKHDPNEVERLKLPELNFNWSDV